MIGCGSILQAMNSTCAFSNVAANSARRLTRWIGNVVQTKWRSRPRYVQINDTWLNYSEAIVCVDLDYLSHARKFDNDAVVERERATRQSGPGAPRSEGNACICEFLHHTRHLFS
jgi:hypothetical protein